MKRKIENNLFPITSLGAISSRPKISIPFYGDYVRLGGRNDVEVFIGIFPLCSLRNLRKL